MLATLCIASLAAFPQQDRRDREATPVLLVGATLAGEIVDGDAEVRTETLRAVTTGTTVGKRFALRVERAGTYHVDLRAPLFDAYLVLRDGDGALLAEDQDGGLGRDAQIVAELAPGVGYTVVACALEGRRGPFELSLGAGRPAELGPEERARAELAEAEARVAAAEERFGARHVETARSVNELAGVHLAQGDHAAALRSFERALGLFEETVGSEHAETASTLNNLGYVRKIQGDLDGARPLYERALAICEEVLGEAAPLTAKIQNNLAGLLETRGDTAAARPLYERALEVYLERLGPDHVDTGMVSNNLAGLLYRGGDHAAARPLFERALAIYEQALGPDHPRTGVCVSNLANLHRSAGDLDGARPLFERALAIFERALGPEHPWTASTQGGLAKLLEDVGDYEAAGALAERALEVTERTFGPEHAKTAGALRRLAVLLRKTGDYAAARPLLERSLAVTERALGPEHPSTALALSDLGALLYLQGELAAGRSLLERALAIRERRLGPRHPETAATLVNLAGLLEDQGHHDEARRAYERALAIYDGVLGPEHPSTVTARNNLAGLLFTLGEYEAARPVYERALASSERTLGPDHPSTAQSLNNLAGLLRAQADPEAALPLFERALAILEESVGPDHPETATALNNLAGVLEDLDQPGRARALYERALAIRQERLGPEHPRTAVVVDNLAHLLHHQGDFDAAEPLFESALATFERSRGPEHPATAKTLHNLASALRGQGELEAALALFERALAIREATLGYGHRETSVSQGSLALIALDQGDTARALELVRRGREEHLRRRAAHLAGQSESERYLYLGTLFWRLEVELAIVGRAGSAQERVRAYESVLDLKGLVARTLHASRERLTSELSAEARARLDELHAAQHRLSELAFRTDVVDLASHAQSLRAAREERNRVEVALARLLEPTREASRAATFAELRTAVPEGAALVDLFLHRPWRSSGDPALEPSSWGELHVSAWITRPEADEPVHVDLGPAAALARAARALLQSMAGDLGPLRGLGLTPRADPRGLAGPALRELLWDPLAPHLEGARTVFLSPDGFLGSVPLGVLPLDDRSHLLERRSFVHLEDPSWLVRRGPAPEEELDTFLAVGGVDFDRRSGSEGAPLAVEAASASVRGPRAGAWSPLPATRLESRAVFELHQVLFGERGTRLLLQGGEPTEERLERELPRHRVLHLATHGFFDPVGVPSLWVEGRAAAAAELASIAAEEEELTGRHPGLLSGLVCAGANRPEAGREDGYLTAEEVAWLDLSGCELVVLSACDTGLGRPQSGEGLLGLRRAFRTAGVATVVSSLWSVPDASTAELMREVYRNLFVRGQGRLEALRSAQLHLLARNRREQGRARPATWGAFVLSGEWR